MHNCRCDAEVEMQILHGCMHTMMLVCCSEREHGNSQLSNLADDGETWPLALTNDIDLVTVWRAISAGPDTF